MPAWTVFGAVIGIVTLVVLFFARATASMLAAEPVDSEDHSDQIGRSERIDADRQSTDIDNTHRRPLDIDDERKLSDIDDTDRPPEQSEIGRRTDDATTRQPVGSPGTDRTGQTNGQQPMPSKPTRSGPRLEELSTASLFANVGLTHGLFAAILVVAAIWTGIPGWALGIEPTPISTGWPAVVYGLGLGIALYLGNALLAANLDLVGVDASDRLRSALAPESIGGWIVLCVGVLPLIALFEELLFRAALIGVYAAGFGISPWLLVIGSSIVFALGHNIQGPGGVLVTGLLGGVLGVAFVYTNSLLLVVVAHYVINALEFLLHEGIGIEGEQWFSIR